MDFARNERGFCVELNPFFLSCVSAKDINITLTVQYVINLGQGHLLTLASLLSIHTFQRSSSLTLLDQSK